MDNDPNHCKSNLIVSQGKEIGYSSVTKSVAWPQTNMHKQEAAEGGCSKEQRPVWTTEGPLNKNDLNSLFNAFFTPLK